MTQYFDNFTEEQTNMFREVFGDNAEYEENKIILYTDYGDIIFVTRQAYGLAENPSYYLAA